MFCTNCGKPLKDGEICDCQKQTSVQPQVEISPIAEAAPIESTVTPIMDVAPINAAPTADASFDQAVAQADATIANAAAAADATINGTQQAPVNNPAPAAEPQIDPIKARIAQQEAENAQAQAAAAAAAAHAGAMAAAQNANNRANQYYQQYVPQQAPAGQPQGQFAQNIPQGGQFNQAPNGQFAQNMPQGQYGQAPQYGQPQMPPNNQYAAQRAQNQYGAPSPYGQAPQQQPNYQYQGNPYPNSYNQAPPSYYGQQVYMSDDERLKKYMSSPKFVAARDFMCSMPVLLYAISVSALLVFFCVTMTSVWDLIHPLYILLCIGAWITFASGLKSKKNNTLPSTSGLSIGSGVAITMLVLWCIAFGLIILILLLGIVAVLQSGVSMDNYGTIVLFVTFAVSILALVLGIKYYSIQSRNLKNIRYCITNEANPRRFSIFPSVILILGVVLSIIGIIGMQGVMGSTRLKNLVSDYLLEYFRESGISKIDKDLPRQFTETIINSVWSTKAQVMSIISSVLGIIEMLSTAVIYISAKSKLNDFTEL